MSESGAVAQYIRRHSGNVNREVLRTTLQAQLEHFSDIAATPVHYTSLTTPQDEVVEILRISDTVPFSEVVTDWAHTQSEQYKISTSPPAHAAMWKVARAIGLTSDEHTESRLTEYLNLALALAFVENPPIEIAAEHNSARSY